MIVAAGLLVLVGLGLFVAGILTGATAFYWGCVAACVVAAVLLLLARRKLAVAATPAATAGNGPVAPVGPPARTDGTPSGEPGTPAAAKPATAVPSSGATALSVDAPVPVQESDPPVEQVEVTDLLLVVDLTDEVLVVDEHPRYHLPGCRHLAGRTTIPIPLDEARTDGFTPCALCAPDRTLAQRARERRDAG